MDFNELIYFGIPGFIVQAKTGLKPIYDKTHYKLS